MLTGVIIGLVLGGIVGGLAVAVVAARRVTQAENAAAGKSRELARVYARVRHLEAAAALDDSRHGRIHTDSVDAELRDLIAKQARRPEDT